MGEHAPVDDAVLEPTRAVALIRRIGNPAFMTTYLMSFQGVSGWVRILRAAGECELHRKGRSNAYTAVEVEGDERDRVIAKYLSRLPAPVKNDFARRPDPAHHPVFRVDPIAES